MIDKNKVDKEYRFLSSTIRVNIEFMMVNLVILPIIISIQS